MMCRWSTRHRQSLIFVCRTQFMSTTWTPRKRHGCLWKISCPRAGAIMPGERWSYVPEKGWRFDVSIGRSGESSRSVSICFNSTCQQYWQPHLSHSAPFYKIMVPTVDTDRYHFLVNALLMGSYPVLLTGPVGTGKTSVAQSVLQGLSERWTGLTINMSSQVGACAQSVLVSRSSLLTQLPGNVTFRNGVIVDIVRMRVDILNQYWVFTVFSMPLFSAAINRRAGNSFN